MRLKPSWLRDKIVVDNDQVLTVDETQIRAEAQIQAQLLEQRVADDPNHTNMVLVDAMREGWL